MENPHGNVEPIAVWRARRAAAKDLPMGVPPFVLEEPCPGCGVERVGILVWREVSPSRPASAFPRIEPHFQCEEGRVLFQEITDAPIPVSAWVGILGRFREAAAE